MVADRAPAPAREIVDYRVYLSDLWHAVPLDSVDPKVWAGDLARSLTSSAEARLLLEEQLVALHRRFARPEPATLALAAYIAAPDTGRVLCALGFELTTLDIVSGPDEFQDSLNMEAATRQPGSVFRGNRTWRRRIDAGELVGGFSLIAHQDIGEEIGHLEQRAVYGVFPVGADAFVQFVFSTDDLNAFLDMADETERIVATVEIEMAVAS